MRPATARRCKCDRPSRRIWLQRTISAPRLISGNSSMSKIARSAKRAVRQTILITVSPRTLGAQTLRTLRFCAHSRNVQKDAAKKNAPNVTHTVVSETLGSRKAKRHLQKLQKKQKRITNTRDKTRKMLKFH